MKDDGGPAFPVSEVMNRNGDVTQYPSGGMTLRDYFAAKAMQAYLASYSSSVPPSLDEMSAFSYEVADIMLKARVEISTPPASPAKE